MDTNTVFVIIAIQLLCLLHCWFNKKLTIGKKVICTPLIGLFSFLGIIIYLLLFCFVFKKKEVSQTGIHDADEDIFDARMSALEKEFGKIDEVLQSGIPFFLGFDAGGQPNVYFFKNHIDGLVAVTADLIGQDQKPSDAGNYELMIAVKEKDDLLIDILKNLTFYTMDEPIYSGDTMDLPLGNKAETNICAIVFDCYKKFTVNELGCGVMAMVGITQEELEYRNQHGGKKLIEKLKECGVYPYFDLNRDSVV